MHFQLNQEKKMYRVYKEKRAQGKSVKITGAAEAHRSFQEIFDTL